MFPNWNILKWWMRDLAKTFQLTNSRNSFVIPEKLSVLSRRLRRAISLACLAVTTGPFSLIG